MLHRLSVRSSAKIEFFDITADIRQLIGNNHIASGTCIVFVPHTTAAVTLNENADPAVLADLRRQFERLAPQHPDLEHSEGNSPAHLAASLTGHSVSMFIEGGKLVLGTWQAVYLAEFDGPRVRNILVKIIPDH
ncbi:secondary thiamine-phosphate synthase enzyme [Dehalogenimonas formicexedens]|uniref:Secondary thiamine-phosphate synthase enzyme n=1 Tax=Dehalogenimonas formicexedens TaxID=1839801 RepID=A0A1P8F925_9CHLR|nr:secondary thiamine-phosphate synthase enzyme YjbQ [Dehalogenimonas formicexedens]APV44945.1 secondary thiamine-phosphate synthase enzyme [Dehalogenimonas formicexedens]